MKSKNFLFVTGCARSGTSALAELIGNHPKIVMGMERYGAFYDAERLELGPEHFEEERFFDARPGDTFYEDFNAFHAWDPNIRTKFKDAIYVGDKRPNIHRHYDQIFRQFPGATIYFIYRDVFDVACSWEARKEAKQDWSPALDFKAAVTTWNESLSHTIDAINAGNHIIPVRYADYFETEGNLYKLLKPLGLSLASTVETHYELQQAVRHELSAVRYERQRVSDAQRKFVDEHADFKALAAMDRIVAQLP